MKVLSNWIYNRENLDALTKQKIIIIYDFTLEKHIDNVFFNSIENTLSQFTLTSIFDIS